MTVIFPFISYKRIESSEQPYYFRVRFLSNLFTLNAVCETPFTRNTLALF
jgi:hypothetical protein